MPKFLARSSRRMNVLEGGASSRTTRDGVPPACHEVDDAERGAPPAEALPRGVERRVVLGPEPAQLEQDHCEGVRRRRGPPVRARGRREVHSGHAFFRDASRRARPRTGRGERGRRGFPVRRTSGDTEPLQGRQDSRGPSSVSPRSSRRASTTSPRATTPRSPWTPLGGMQEGTRGACPSTPASRRSLRPMSPDLPMPVHDHRGPPPSGGSRVDRSIKPLVQFRNETQDRLGFEPEHTRFREPAEGSRSGLTPGGRRRWRRAPWRSRGQVRRCAAMFGPSERRAGRRAAFGRGPRGISKKERVHAERDRRARARRRGRKRRSPARNGRPAPPRQLDGVRRVEDHRKTEARRMFGETHARSTTRLWLAETRVPAASVRRIRPVPDREDLVHDVSSYRRGREETAPS